jgi:hypothetical protein
LAASAAFNTEIAESDHSLCGPWRCPKQMLHAQTYDSHASIHDDVTAQKLGFKAGTIEGPTHFSQFEPLAEKIWGTDWFETGCISAHFRNAVFEGEEVQAIFDTPRVNERTASIRMTKRDGTEVLRGTASVGGDGTETALYQRLRELKPLADPVLLRDIKVGMKTPRQTVRMDFDQRMGDLYPFSLREKLKAITEPSQYYSGKNNPWGLPIIPFEMLAVLFRYRASKDRLPIRGPVVGLYADQEIRLLGGPLFVGDEYITEREIVALSGSRRTESVWTHTRVFGRDGKMVATMLLNVANIKESYANHQKERDELYGQGG